MTFEENIDGVVNIVLGLTCKEFSLKSSDLGFSSLQNSIYRGIDA